MAEGVEGGCTAAARAAVDVCAICEDDLEKRWAAGVWAADEGIFGGVEGVEGVWVVTLASATGGVGAERVVLASTAFAEDEEAVFRPEVTGGMEAKGWGVEGGVAPWEVREA